MSNIKHKPANNKECRDYTSLAKALGIELNDLLLLDFYNKDLFDSGGILTRVQYIFSKDNPGNILSKIKKLDENNSVIINAKELSYYTESLNADE
jgi:hypothetical protein